MSSTLKSILSALLFIPSLLASPLSSSSTFEPLATRSVINCTSLTAQRNVACWDSLNIASYLTNWRNTTPDCTISNGNGSDCCLYSKEPWSTCYLRLNHGGDFTCNDLSPVGCRLQTMQPRQDIDPAVKPQAHYVIAAIKHIHDFFAAYETGATFH